MEKYYSINELALITGLTTRTLRNYLQMNILTGHKENGAWQFSEEDISEFLGNPNVKPSIQAKHNAIVFDFLADRKKKENEICMVLDMKASAADAGKKSSYFCDAVNAVCGSKNIRLAFEKHGEYVRVILSGDEDAVKQIMKDYYEE